MKSNLNDNVVNFPKGKRLPSVEGMSDEDLKYLWEGCKQRETTTIAVGDIIKLEVPDYAVEQQIQKLTTLKRPQRRKIQKNSPLRIERFLEFMGSNPKETLPEGSLENLLEEIVGDVVLQESFKQLKDRRVA